MYPRNGGMTIALRYQGYTQVVLRFDSMAVATLIRKQFVNTKRSKPSTKTIFPSGLRFALTAYR